MTILTTPDLCYCLAGRRSARQITRIYERHLASTGLTSTQFSIISVLVQYPDMTMIELAQAMEFERTTLVRMVKPMKEAGWLAEGAEKVGRAYTLHVTDSGLAKLEEGRPNWAAAQEEFESSIGRDAAHLFRDVMHSVVPPLSASSPASSRPA